MGQPTRPQSLRTPERPRACVAAEAAGPSACGLALERAAAAARLLLDEGLGVVEGLLGEEQALTMKGVEVTGKL